eukprot:3564369-Rhodomonas_salina.2
MSKVKDFFMFSTSRLLETPTHFTACLAGGEPHRLQVGPRRGSVLAPEGILAFHALAASPSLTERLVLPEPGRAPDAAAPACPVLTQRMVLPVSKPPELPVDGSGPRGQITDIETQSQYILHQQCD